jgi:hypothetical protein
LEISSQVSFHNYDHKAVSLERADLPDHKLEGMDTVDGGLGLSQRSG